MVDQHCSKSQWEDSFLAWLHYSLQQYFLKQLCYFAILMRNDKTVVRVHLYKYSNDAVKGRKPLFPLSNPWLIPPGLLSTHFKRSVTSSTWGLLLTAITPCTMAHQGVLFLSHILGWMLTWNQIMWKLTDNRWSLSSLIGGCECFEFLTVQTQTRSLTHRVHTQIHR